MRHFVSNLVKSRFRSAHNSHMILRPSSFSVSNLGKFRVTNCGVFRISNRQFFKKTTAVLGAKKDFYSKYLSIIELF